MPIATVKQLCTPNAVVASDSLVEQVAQIEDFASGKIDGRSFFQRNYFTRDWISWSGVASSGLPAKATTAHSI